MTLGISAAAGAEVARGVVTGLEADGGGRWEVTLEAGDAIAADGVVLTKARPVITVPGQPREHPRVLDGRANWLSYGENRFYSDPARWPCLAEAHRSESLTLLGQQSQRPVPGRAGRRRTGTRDRHRPAGGRLASPLHLPVMAGLAPGAGVFRTSAASAC